MLPKYCRQFLESLLNIIKGCFDGRGFISGSSLNRKTTAEAEALALKSCENGQKRWPRYHWGKCEIHASKWC